MRWRERTTWAPQNVGLTLAHKEYDHEIKTQSPMHDLINAKDKREMSDLEVICAI